MNKHLQTSLLLVVFITACQYTTRFGEKIYTPKKFLNHTIVSSSSYSNDSSEILKQLKQYLKKHEQSFYNKEYFDSTEITIDTILYSMDLNKVAVFVITKTPMYRRKEIAQDKKFNYWYDAYCYIGIRIDTPKKTLELKWVRRSYPINWYKKDEISSVIRDEYFTEFAAIKDTSGEYNYKYNLDDKRFWDCPIWDEYFGK